MELLQAAFYRGHGEMFKSTSGSTKTPFSTVKIINTVKKIKDRTEINVCVNSIHKIFSLWLWNSFRISFKGT